MAKDYTVLTEEHSLRLARLVFPDGDWRVATKDMFLAYDNDGDVCDEFDITDLQQVSRCEGVVIRHGFRDELAKGLDPFASAHKRARNVLRLLDAQPMIEIKQGSDSDLQANG